MGKVGSKMYGCLYNIIIFAVRSSPAVQVLRPMDLRGSRHYAVGRHYKPSMKMVQTFIKTTIVTRFDVLAVIRVDSAII